MPIIKEIILEIVSDAAEKDLKSLDKGVQKVDKSVEDLNDTTNDTEKSMGAFATTVDKMTNGGVTGFKNMVQAVKKGNISLKAMKVALIATGIGAFVVLVGSLAANFGNSEEGANKLNKVLDKIKVVTGNVTDIFYNLSQSLVSFLSGNFDEAAKQFGIATDKIKNFRKETEREVKVAGQLADKKAELLEIERKLTVDRAEADRKRADLLDKAANREEYTALERIEFLKEAGAIEQAITDEEIKAAQIRLFIKQEENKASVSGTEDLNAEAELKAELIRLDTARLTKQKEITSQIQGAKGEETARLQGLANARQTEIDNFQAHRDTLDKILIKSVDKQEQATIKTGDITSDLKKRAAKDEIKTDKLTSDQKLSVASDTLGNLAGLLGESSSAGKAAAIAQTTIETYKGAQSAFSSLAGIPVVGPVLGGIAAAAAIASGIATVKQITSVKTPGGKGGGGSSISAPRRATVPSAPPSFNVVGASETNQLAQTIGQEEKKPVKAYVVSNDVSNAQALDRNIVENASIG